MSLFKINYDLEISMQLIWEFTIYIENKINFLWWTNSKWYIFSTDKGEGAWHTQ